MTTCSEELRSLIRIHQDGIPASLLWRLMRCGRHGQWTDEEIRGAMTNALVEAFAHVDGDGLWHQTAFSVAQERYQEHRLLEPSWKEKARAFLRRCLGARYWKLWLALALPLLATVACVGIAQGAEGKWIEATATAYCPCNICCEGSDDGITANGTRTDEVPYAVAASRNIPLGSRVYIPLGSGYLDVSRSDQRWFQVDDRGSALTSEWKATGETRLDLRYRTHHSAKLYGRRVILVYISTPL